MEGVKEFLRTKALWIVVALLALNAVLFAAAPGLAVPRGLSQYFFGPKLVRAEIVVRDGGEVRLYRVDRGRIRTIRPALGTLTVLERDGTTGDRADRARRGRLPERAHGAPARAAPRHGRHDGAARRRAGRNGGRGEIVNDAVPAGAVPEAVAASPVGATALVVEDEDSIGQLVRSYLERDGYRVVWARSGEEALAELERHPVRVVVLDIGLPGHGRLRRLQARSARARACRS